MLRYVETNDISVDVQDDLRFLVRIWHKEIFSWQGLIEPRREKTGFLHMQKQRRRSSSR